MRIPTEHFTATPVFALSPTTKISTNCNSSQYNSTINGQTMQSTSYQKPQPPQFASLCVTNCHKSIIPKSLQREKKISLPASLGLFGTNNLQSVGSAPTSPTLSRTNSYMSGDGHTEKQAAFPFSGVSTSIQGGGVESDSSYRPNVPTIFGAMTSLTSGNNSYYESSCAPGNLSEGVILRRDNPKENSGIKSKYATLPRK